MARYKAVHVNCRNFKCRFNKSGNCSQEEIVLTPLGAIIGELTCIEAGEKEEDVKVS